jgi:Ca2+-binding EF-hand superfamily protein
MYNNLQTKAAFVLAFIGMFGTAVADEDMFKQLDKDADGYISAEEAGAHQALTMGYINADTNEDGKIDAAEFSAFEIQNQSLQPVQDK